LVSSYSGDYEISGIIDPFLQVQIIVLFRRLGEGNEAISEEINDVLTQVINTGDTFVLTITKRFLQILPPTRIQAMPFFTNALEQFSLLNLPQPSELLPSTFSASSSPPRKAPAVFPRT